MGRRINHGGDRQIPSWVVGIVVMLAVLWAAYVLLTGSERVREAGDEVVNTAAQVRAVARLGARPGAPL